MGFEEFEEEGGELYQWVDESEDL